jgi:hypothetical protein
LKRIIDTLPCIKTIMSTNATVGMRKALEAYSAKQAVKQAAYNAVSDEVRLAAYLERSKKHLERDRLAKEAEFKSVWNTAFPNTAFA